MNHSTANQNQSQEPSVRKITDWRDPFSPDREECRAIDEHIAKRVNYPVFMYAPHYTINESEAMQLVIGLPIIFTLQSTDKGWRAWFEFEHKRRYTAEGRTPALAICLTWLAYDADVLARANGGQS